MQWLHGLQIAEAVSAVTHTKWGMHLAKLQNIYNVDVQPVGDSSSLSSTHPPIRKTNTHLAHTPCRHQVHTRSRDPTDVISSSSSNHHHHVTLRTHIQSARVSRHPA